MNEFSAFFSQPFQVVFITALTVVFATYSMNKTKGHAGWNIFFKGSLAVYVLILFFGVSVFLENLHYREYGEEPKVKYPLIKSAMWIGWICQTIFINVLSIIAYIWNKITQP